MKLIINTKAFPSFDPATLQEILGVLPYWVHEYTLLGKDANIVDFMANKYGFGRLYEFKGSVLDDGTYSYPDAPDLPYVGKIKTPNGNAYFYEYAMLALPLPNGTHFVTRMD